MCAAMAACLPLSWQTSSPPSPSSAPRFLLRLAMSCISCSRARRKARKAKTEKASLQPLLGVNEEEGGNSAVLMEGGRPRAGEEARRGSSSWARASVWNTDVRFVAASCFHSPSMPSILLCVTSLLLSA